MTVISSDHSGQSDEKEQKLPFSFWVGLIVVVGALLYPVSYIIPWIANVIHNMIGG